MLQPKSMVVGFPDVKICKDAGMQNSRQFPDFSRPISEFSRPKVASKKGSWGSISVHSDCITDVYVCRWLLTWEKQGQIQRTTGAKEKHFLNTDASSTPPPSTHTHFRKIYFLKLLNPSAHPSLTEETPTSERDPKLNSCVTKGVGPWHDFLPIT